MSNNNYIPSREWKPKTIGYAKCKANPGGLGRSGLINNKKGKPIDIITPMDMLCWGAEQGKDGSGNFIDKYSVSIQFPNEEYPNEEHSAFLAKVKEFEAQLLADAIQNYHEWFPNLVSDEADADTVAAITIKRGFKSTLKYPKIPNTEKSDYNRPPTLRVNLGVWDGKPKYKLYDSSTRELIYPKEGVEVTDALKKMDKITAFLRCGGRWFVNDTWGYKWNLEMATVSKSDFAAEPENPWDIIDFAPPSKGASATAVEEDDGITLPSSVKNAVVTPTTAVATTVPVPPPISVESEAEEEEEETKPEPEPEPEPEPVKKTVVKKKPVVKKA
jgi:hypothetical protein